MPEPNREPLAEPPEPAREPAAPSATRVRLGAIAQHRALPIALLVLMYATSVLVYSLLARKQAVPTLGPDEIFYGKLAQGLAFGGGREWRGSSYGLPPLWPTVLSLAWDHGSIVDGYGTAKTIGAVVISTTIVPVWLLARTYVGARLALVAAALAVIGVWMQMTDFIVSENLAYPLATASLAMTVMAATDPRMRWIWGSLAFAVVASLTRTQMLVLPVILVVALVLDVVRQPREARRARIDERPAALWIGLITVVLFGLLAFVVKPDLTSYDVLEHPASFGKSVSTTLHEGIGSIALFAFVPVVATIALMTRKENWRDEKVGALLVTIVAALLVIYPVAGRFLAWATDGLPVDRYAMYLAPLLLVALMVAPSRISRRAALVAAVLTGAAMIGAGKMGNFLEQGGTYGIQKALFDNGVGGGHLKTGVVVVAFVVSLLGAVALTSRRHPALGLGCAILLSAGLMVAQNWAARSYEYSLSVANRHLFIPSRLDWVDQFAKGPVATLDVGKDVALRANSVVYTEFFNRKVKWYYSTIGTGTGCDVDLASDGRVKHGDGKCVGWPRNWVLAEGPITTTLHDQKVLATTTNSGTLVETPPGPPRILSLVSPPCTRYGCTGQFQLGLYLDKPSKVTVSFGPGQVAHQIQIPSESAPRTLPAGKPVNLNFKLDAGPQAANIAVDWSEAAGAPALASVVVKTEGKTLRLY